MRSGAAAAVMLVIIAAMAGGCLGTAPAPQASKDIVVGALVPLTGDRGSEGRNFDAAITLAVQDTNANLAAGGSPRRVRLLVEDTATDPAVAAEKIRKLQEAGARVVVGPATSAEMTRVKDWADQHGMVLLGYAATSPDLSVPGDNVFRLVPDDTRQGEAMAAYLNRSGIRVIVPVVRNDVWGTGLLAATRARFEKNGGHVTRGYLFGPGTGDFAPIVHNLSADVAAAQREYGGTGAGVYAVGFEEVVPLLSSAAGDPVLASVRWFGSDGSAKLAALTDNVSAARVAAKTGFSNPLYSVEEESGGLTGVRDRIRAVTGTEPDAYQFAAYDAAAIAARSLLISDGASYDQLKNSVAFTADYYYGITGWTGFVESGDRAYAVYRFWTVRSDNGTYTWERTARFESDPDRPGRFT
jgi:branched-chain amino acid transport system substrate-binding protein